MTSFLGDITMNPKTGLPRINIVGAGHDGKGNPMDAMGDDLNALIHILVPLDAPHRTTLKAFQVEDFVMDDGTSEGIAVYRLTVGAVIYSDGDPNRELLRFRGTYNVDKLSDLMTMVQHLWMIGYDLEGKPQGVQA